MARKKVNEEPVDKVEEITATVAHVMQNGKVVRTYSIEDHGDEFISLANVYVDTRDDSYSVVTA